MVVVSSREFRQNQRLYFEKVDKGDQIIIQRGKDKSYILTPVDQDDLYFNAEMVKRIRKSLKQAENADVKKISTPEDITTLLGL
jgi:PHD/YefM family antitoxin component YafN of YafNO toxin-antitoxin module